MTSALYFGIMLSVAFLTRRFLRQAVDTLNEGILSPEVQNAVFGIDATCPGSTLSSILLCENATTVVEVNRTLLGYVAASFGLATLEGFDTMQVTDYEFTVDRQSPSVNSTILMDVTVEATDVSGTWAFNIFYDPPFLESVNRTQGGVLFVGDVTATATALVYVDCERDGVYVTLDSFTVSEIEWFEPNVWVPILSLGTRALQDIARELVANVNTRITLVVNNFLGDALVAALDVALADLQVRDLRC